MENIKKMSKKKKVLAFFITISVIIMLPIIYSAADNTTYELIINSESGIKESTEFNINIKSTNTENLTETEILIIKLGDKIELNETILKERNIEYKYDLETNTLEIEGNNIKDIVEIPVKALTSGETTIELYKGSEKIDIKTINIEKEVSILPPPSKKGKSIDIHVPDANLRKVINNELGRGFVDNSEYFTISELESLYVIIYDSPVKPDKDKISDLTGLEYATNIIEMYLNHNNIKDITPLENLTNLSSLDLSFNQIADVSPLEVIRDNVMWSTIAGQKIDLGDISMQGGEIEIENPIKTNSKNTIEQSIKDAFIASGATYDSTSNKFKWTGLKGGESIKVPFVWEDYNPNQLYFSGEVVFTAKLTDIYIPDPNLRKAINNELGRGLVSTPEYFKISELEGLTKLSYASSTKTDAEKITDLTGLDYAINIKDLNLSYNKISDMTIISKITGLEKLTLNNNQIVDISPIDKLINLKSFAARYNQIVDISYLQNLSEITNVNLGFNKVSNLSPIANLGKLTGIDFTGNNVSNIEALKDMIGLTSISIGQNQISDITPLTNLINLTSLNLYQNKVSNIDAISDKDKITYLVLSSNNIIDISPLNNIISKITYFNASNQTTNLGKFRINGNSLSLDNPVITIGGKAPITTISNFGTYDSTNSTVNWSNLSKEQPLSFSFKDNTRMFDGTVSLAIEQNIHIPDVNLRKAINSELGRGLVSSPEYFTKEEMQSLTKLSHSEANKTEAEKIVSLVGLEYAINITNINFSYNKIVDVKELAQLTKLSSLIMDHNNIVDITSLSNLSELTNLNLSHNSIVDLFIANLKKLTTVDVQSNNINTITSVQGLTNIEVLNVSYNKISNIDPLINLVNLTDLRIMGNQISYISSLNDKTKLTILYMTSNKISDITPIANLTNLTKLNMAENQISDISALNKLTKLTTLDAGTNQITNISIISNLTNLTEIKLPINKIKDVTPIANLTKLKTLHLFYNEISDISSLNGIIGNITNFSLDNQSINLGTVRVNGTKLSLDNPTKTIEGKVPVTVVSDSGVYDTIENTINWSNLGVSQTRTFDFKDSKRSFNGRVTLIVEKVGIKDPTNPNADNNNPNPEGIVDSNHDLKLAINYIEPIDFGIIDIESRNMNIEAVTKTPYIQISDLRDNPTGWKLGVSGTTLKEQSGATIDGARIRLKDGTLKSSPTGNIDIPTISDDIIISLDNSGDSGVMEAQSGKGIGTWLGIWDSTGVTNEKVTMEIPAGKARMGKYTTTLNWTLSDTP